MNSFKLFGFKRKLEVFSPVEVFFELHSIVTEEEKGKKRAENSNFLANYKSLNEFNMKKLAITLTICLLTFTINAQKATEKAKDYSDNVKTLDSIISSLYTVISGEKGKTRDWALFKHLFKPDAKLIPSGKDKKGVYKVRYMKPDDYIKSSGKWLVDNGFFEKEIHRKVDAFGNIAQVFSTYEAFKSKADDKPFMRGINSIQLFYDGLRWWIVNVYWTQESKENPIRKVYLPKQ